MCTMSICKQIFMILLLLVFAAKFAFTSQIQIAENDLKLGDVHISSGTYQIIVPRLRPRWARYCSLSSSSCSQYRRPSPCDCPSSSSCSSFSSSPSCSSDSSSSMPCFACNQEMTYSFSTPGQIKFINIVLGKRCQPDRRGCYNKHCRFEVLSDNKRIFSSKKPCGPIAMGTGLHDVSMILYAPEIARLFTSSINPDCPPSTAGICFNFEHYAKVCFCSAWM